jgi:hypothetical protein
VSFVALALGAFVSSAAAQSTESEPNDSKATANAITGMTDGHTITGNSTGSSTTTAGTTSADYYSLTLAARTPGIYRYRLLLSSATAGHTGTLRGLTQTGGVPNAGTDATGQTSSATSSPARFNQFYSFGAGSQIFYRVTGAAATTADYTATLESVAVTPTTISTQFTEGNSTITTVGQGHTSDTDIWVYDSNFNAIPGFGNDDHFGGATFGSELTREYAPGTYHLALSTFQLMNDQGSPPDDDFRTGAVADFPGVVWNSSTTLNVNTTFSITDSDGNSLQVANTRAGAYDINWFTFQVNAIPEPASLGLLALAAPALLIRRRR